MNYIKHSSIIFCQKNHIKTEITLKSLAKVARSNGYIIYKYTAARSIMLLLGVYEESLKATSVSVKDGAGNIIIFIDDTAGQSRQLFALAHEIGHIVLEHKPTTDKALKNKQEAEADKFAHYLLSLNQKKPSSRKITFAATAIVLCICGLLAIFKSSEKSSESSIPTYNVEDYSFDTHDTPELNAHSTYYWTESGRVFHLYSDCQSLKNSSEILSGTLSEAENEKERLCKFCEGRSGMY